MKFLLVFSFSFLLFMPWQNSHAAFMPKSFSANIEQKIASSLGSKRISSGIIKYKAKGSIYFEIVSPKREMFKFISNPEKSWYYVPPFNEKSKGELTIQPTSKMPLTLFFDTLDNGLVSNKFYDVNKIGDHFIIVFKDKLNKQFSLDKAFLYFSSEGETFSHLQKIILFYNDKREVELNLSQTQIDVPLENSLFNFEPPANTNIKK